MSKNNYLFGRTKLEKLPDDITMVINNAGFSKVGHFLDVTEEDFDMWAGFADIYSLKSDSWVTI